MGMGVLCLVCTAAITLMLSVCWLVGQHPQSVLIQLATQGRIPHNLIVSEALVGSSYEIFLIDQQSGQQRQLTSHIANDRFPVLSPAADRVAFVSWRDDNSEIYLIDNATGTLRNISNHPDRDVLPVWSPDGTLLAYSSHLNGNFDVMVIDVLRGLVQNATRNPAHDSHPQWLPDSQGFVFSTNRNGGLATYMFELAGHKTVHDHAVSEWQTRQHADNITVTDSEIPG